LLLVLSVLSIMAQSAFTLPGFLVQPTLAPQRVRSGGLEVLLVLMALHSVNGVEVAERSAPELFVASSGELFAVVPENSEE